MKLQIDTELTNFITQNSQRNIICSLLADIMYSDSTYEYKASEGLITTDINWVRRSIDNPEMISYLPTKKFNSDIDPFEDGIGRMQVRTGKFINKIFTPKCFKEYGIKDADIEKFVNLFKSESTKYEGTYFEVVEGTSINKYYNCENYHRNEEEEARGTLWSSCMRKTEMYEFFNIYADNCKMLVLFTKERKVLGRALLWEVMTPDKKTHYNFMDRIYFYEDSEVELFKKWALDNNYITKAYQDHHNYPSFMIDGKIRNLDLQVKLVKSEYEYYPYMDTFKFLCRKLKYLRNFDRLGKTWTLVQTDGNCEEIPDDDSEESEESYNYDDE